MVKFISVLVTLFSLFFFTIAQAEVVDRIVAYVDNYAITLRDFENMVTKMKNNINQIKNEDIVNIMINRAILLKKAKEFFVEGKEEELINNYIDLQIKSYIIIPENKIIEYYEKNKEHFKDAPYTTVRTEIERYLFEKELNEKLKVHIEELKETVEIKIIFIP